MIGVIQTCVATSFGYTRTFKHTLFKNNSTSVYAVDHILFHLRVGDHHALQNRSMGKMIRCKNGVPGLNEILGRVAKVTACPNLTTD